MLKEIRLNAGLSQSKLADKSGVNVRMIQYYEQGSKDINGAHIETLIALAIALKCPISDLLTDEKIIEDAKKASL